MLEGLVPLKGGRHGSSRADMLTNNRGRLTGKTITVPANPNRNFHLLWAGCLLVDPRVT